MPEKITDKQKAEALITELGITENDAYWFLVDSGEINYDGTLEEPIDD